MSGFGGFNTTSSGGSTFGNSGTSGFGTAGSAGVGGFGTTGSTGAGGFGSTNTASVGGFGTSTATPTSGFGSNTTGAFGASNTGGFGNTTSTFGGTSTSGFGATTSNAGSFGSSSTLGSGLFGASSSAGTGAFGTPGASVLGSGFAGTTGFGATKTSLGGFDNSRLGGPATTSTATSSTTTSSAFAGFGLAGTSKPTLGGGFGGFGSTSAATTNNSFGGFGSTTASNPTLGSGFGGFGSASSSSTTSLGFGSSTAFGAQQPPALFDISELKPWELFDQIPSISETEATSINLNKREGDPFSKANRDGPPPQPNKPEKEAVLTKGKLDYIQTFALPDVDLISGYLDFGSQSLLTSGLYFSEDTDTADPEAMDEDLVDVSDDVPPPVFTSSSESGFLTTPTLHQLSSMSKAGLKRVEGFSLQLPGIGRADFPHAVDLSTIAENFQKNLQKIFIMRRGGFSILSPQDLPSLQNTGLLGPVNVILYHLWLVDPVTGARIYSASHPSYNAMLTPFKQISNTTFQSFDLKKGHWSFSYKLSSTQ